MNYTTCVLYWGYGKYEPLLFRWLGAYKGTSPIAVLTDLVTPLPPLVTSDDQIRILRVDPLAAGVPHNAAYPFDYKAALVCSLLQQTTEALFVVDADALVVADPTPHLSKAERAPLAMPLDEGALNQCIAGTSYKKRCAGVMWFGEAPAHIRSGLVNDYITAFYGMQTNDGEDRRLCEQNAWSLVAGRGYYPVLPRELNWPDHFRHVGPNPNAAILHRIGRRKWAKQT